MARPKKLSSAWWKKNKEKTVRDQGLEKALQNWETLISDAPIISRASYQKVNATTIEIVSSANATIKKCNKKLHNESIGHCNDFIALAKQAKKDMKAKQQKYILKYMEFIELRKDTLKEFKKLLKEIENISNGNVKLINKVKQRAMDLLIPVRTPKVRPLSYLHRDDVSDGLEWLTKIFTVNKALLKRLNEKEKS